MAKTNKYKSKGPAKTGASSAGNTRTVRPAKASTGDGECHVNVPVSDSKPVAAVQQEVLQTPVLSVPPLESTVETWADPIADNSSYASAESEEPSPGATTPPAAAMSLGAAVATLPASTQQTITEPAAAAAVAAPPSETAAPAVVSVPVETPAVLAPAAAAEPAAPLGYDLADEAADEAPKLAPKPAGAAPAAALVLSWAELLLRAYTFPAYLTAGATVGLVRGVMDQLPLRH